MSKETGGSAFPFGQTDFETGQLCNDWGSEGMTLRDYFASKAMLAMCSQYLSTCDEDYIAKQSYKMADALLRAREGNQ